MKKFQKISLYIGIIIVIISIVVIIVNYLNVSISEYEQAMEIDAHLYSDFWFWSIQELIFTKVPLVFAEISVIKNIYVFLGKELSTIRKILCIISTLLAVLVFVCLYIFENVNYMYHVLQDFMLASWIISIASFILGSRRIAKIKDNW